MLAPHAYQPDPRATPVYNELYALYSELHDGFGGVAGAHTDYPTLMKRLLAIRERAVAAGARPMVVGA
jgi:L-ribulokinase